MAAVWSKCTAVYVRTSQAIRQTYLLSGRPLVRLQSLGPAKTGYSIAEYPVFAKAGAIVPTENYSGDNTLGNKTDMTVYVFPGADNSFVLYEDSGDGNEYKNGEYATTDFSLNWGETAVFTIHSAQGETSLIPKNRNWTVMFRGFAESIAVKAFVNGKETECELSFDKKTNTASVSIGNIPTCAEIVFEISGENSLETDNSSAKDRILTYLCIHR